MSTNTSKPAKALKGNAAQVGESRRLGRLNHVPTNKRKETWCKQHAEFVLAYNAIVEVEGLPLSQWRSF